MDWHAPARRGVLAHLAGLAAAADTGAERLGLLRLWVQVAALESGPGDALGVSGGQTLVEAEVIHRLFGGRLDTDSPGQSQSRPEP